MSNDLAHLIASGPSERVELASPTTTLDAILRNVCGMLNQQGGLIFWGVGARKRVVGLPNAAEQAKRLNDYLAANVRPRPFVSVEVETVGSQNMIVVDVPPGSDKPYALARTIWIRIGRETLRATPAASSELVERSSTQLGRWERDPALGFSLDACDSNELSRTRREIAASGRFGISIPESDEELLSFLNVVVGGHFTNACVVLFARSPKTWANNLSIRIVSYGSARHDSILSDTALDGPAVSLTHEAVALVQRWTGFSGMLDSSSLQRSDRPAYPLFALREGLVNAIVHRDYSALGSVRIELYPESLVIRNPGQLPTGWTTVDLRRDHASQPTNPDIARVFYLRGLMEQLGTGTRRMIAACKEAGARPPRWIVDSGTVSLTLFRAPVSVRLSVRQSDFLKGKRAGQSFALHAYARSAGVSERQARRDLQEMERLGYLERRGKGPATRYRVRPRHDDWDDQQDYTVQRYRDDAPTTDKEARRDVDSMVNWFFERYEDPANGVPYDSGEGGYQYVMGGPYDAEEELREQFEDGTKRMERMITAAARRIENQGVEWVKKGEY